MGVVYREGLINVYRNGELVPDFYRVSVFPAGEMNIELKEEHLWELPVTYDLEVLPGKKVSGEWVNAFQGRWLEELLMLVGAMESHYGHREALRDLFLPYFPYSRADRKIQKNGYFQSNMFSVMHGILSGIFLNIRTKDLHNPVYDDHGWMSPILNTVVRLGENTENTVFLFPDKGSTKKELFRDVSEKNLPFVVFDKVRSDEGVQIVVSEEKNLPESLHGFRGVIMDDICDGGATFIELAKAIREIPKFREMPLELHVTHGIFSKGKECLKEHFSVVDCSVRFLEENE